MPDFTARSAAPPATNDTDPHARGEVVGAHGVDDHGGDHGHDDHAHGGDALGPIDVRAWGAGALGIALGLVTIAVLATTTGNPG
jgi:hypothetical protein